MEQHRTRLLAAVAAGLALAGASPAGAQPCFDVSVFAGRGIGDGGPATSALLVSPRSVAVDAGGVVYIADSGNQRVRKLATDGTISTIAGNGAPGSAADGEPAALAELDGPSGLALDAGGLVYIADTENDTVWRVDADGTLRRIAGSGVRTGSIDGDNPGAPGNDASDDLNDGQLAAIATLSRPLRLAFDSAGNLLISDFGNGRVRRVSAADGRIETLVGGLIEPIGVAVAANGDVLVVSRGSHQLFRVSGGIATAIAGTGVAGFPVNDVPALGSPLNGPAEVAIAGDGTIYLADTNNNQIRSITADQMIHRVVGDGVSGFREGPAILARFRHPGVTLAPDGTLVIPDVDNNRIRRYDPATDAPTVTIAGGDNVSGDGQPATDALLNRPTGLAIDAAGNAYVTEHDGHRVRKIDPAGTISTVVNQQGLNGSAIDNTAAVNATLRTPTGVTLSAAGELLVADAADNRILVVDGTGLIRGFAGNGIACPPTDPPSPCGDGGPATNAMLNTPLRTAVAPDGTVHIADFNSHRIRRIDAAGTISTVAGNGFPGYGGDGGPATQAVLQQPAGLVFDAAGNLYVADFANHRVRKVAADGTITTVAGTGTGGSLGDGGPGSSAQLNGPTDVALAGDGALVIVDQLNNRVRRLAPDGSGAITGGSTITTIVGDGRPTFEDGPGRQASLLIPTDVEIHPDGSLLLADRGNQRVRLAAPLADCSAIPVCSEDADCGDGDDCTADTCDPVANACVHQAINSPECRPRCAAHPQGCIPGGGPPTSDCLLEAYLDGTRSGNGPTVACKDGDTACDFDPQPGVCGFRLAWCLNEPGTGCSAAPVARVIVNGRAGSAVRPALAELSPGAIQRGAAVIFATPIETPEMCTALSNVGVGLKKNGRKAGKLKVKAKAVTAAPRRTDRDKLKLVCLP
jgi:trimeric autotransporter adhesin